MPNASTLRSTDLRRQNHRYALAFRGDKPVGAFELDLSEQVPELASLAVEPSLRRQGLGRSLLRSALDSLGAKASSCSLLVSSANPAALALYESEGFVQTGVVSSWFEVV